MLINWLGHSCFLLTNDNNDRVLVDPYDSYVGKEMTKVSADVVVLSHGHKDHSAVENVISPQIIIDKMGKFCYNNIKINTFYRYHDNKGGDLRGKTLITTIKTDGLNICHLGDIGEDCTDDIASSIGNTDILLIPVGGTYTIDSKQAKVYVDKLKPNIVIPMHYKNSFCVFDIDGVDNFTALFDKKVIIKNTTKDLLITKETLKTSKPNIILMQLA